jgi:hypothetical protein
VLKREEEIAARTRKYLKRLSRNIFEAACDLQGFGPYAEHEIAARTGTGVESRLRAMDEALSALLDQLRDLRSEYLRSQLDALGIDDESRDLKLHIACGSRRLEGWINIDCYPAPLSMCALWNLPFTDGAVIQVLVSRAPESLFYPVEIRSFLSEVGRVLASGGLLEIAMPDSAARRNPGPATREQVYTKWARGLESRTRLDHLLDGSSGKPIGSVDALMHMLVEEGFADIRLEDQKVCASRPKHFSRRFAKSTCLGW